MENKNKNSLPEIDNRDFIRLPRTIKYAYLNNELSFDEMLLLVWLWWGANPRRGATKVSYAELSADLQTRYTKNHINKLMLALKKKKWIWFPRQQGRRSSFEVEIHNYPLSNKHFKDIKYRFNENSGRSSETTIDKTDAEETAEDNLTRQKLKGLEEKKSGLVNKLSMPSNNHFGRSANNDN